MADMRFLKTNHQRTKLRETEPLRHLAPQYAPLGLSTHPALAGNDKDKSQALAVGALYVRIRRSRT